MKRSIVLLLILLMFGSTGWAQLEKGDEIRILSDSLRITDQTGVIQFEGSVRVLLTETTLTCDSLTVRTSVEDPSQVLSGRAVGNVVVERGQERVEAGEANFDIEKGTVELTGSPFLIKGRTTIQADRIIYLLDEGTADFQGPVRAVFLPAGE
jgi:lipopolysaccharide transport protein LptA